jgi:hypothetical protein
VCVLVIPGDFIPSGSALSVLEAEVDAMLRAGIGGFVFDLTEFSRHSDLEERLGHLVPCMLSVVSRGGVLNWLHGSGFVQEWKRLEIFGVPPDNFETEREAVEEIQIALNAARIRPDLAQRVLNSGVSIKDVANVAGLFETDVRRIVEGREQPSDRIVLLIASTVDSLQSKKRSTREPGRSNGSPGTT